MKKNMYVLPALLAAVTAVALLAIVLVRTFLPNFLTPRAGVCELAALSLAALVAEHYLTGNSKRCWVCVVLFSAATFWLLPLACGYVTLVNSWRTAVLGCVVFTVTTFLYTLICDRLETGKSNALTPVLTALCLYLAAQIFIGMV